MGDTVARAFELARSGECRSVFDVHQRLKAEHFEAVAQHLDGKTIKQQLRTAIKEAALRRNAEQAEAEQT